MSLCGIVHILYGVNQVNLSCLVNILMYTEIFNLIWWISYILKNVNDLLQSSINEQLN